MRTRIVTSVSGGHISKKKVEFPNGLDSQVNGSFEVVHNLGRFVDIIDVMYMDTVENEAKGIARMSIVSPVITQSSMSFEVNGVVNDAFEISYR
jgi:hypothetical protein